MRVDGQALGDPPTVAFEVSRTTEEALGEVIADLWALDVPSGDRGHVRAAIALLQLAQAANAPGFLVLEERIRLSAEAAEKLGKVEGADISAQRTEVDKVVAAWERLSYEIIGSGRGRR